VVPEEPKPKTPSPAPATPSPTTSAASKSANFMPRMPKGIVQAPFHFFTSSIAPQRCYCYWCFPLMLTITTGWKPGDPIPLDQLMAMAPPGN